MKYVKVALFAGLIGFVSVAEADQAMPYCFHLDGTTDNAGSSVLSTDYKVTKDGSSYDCFSSNAKFGTKAVGGGSSGPAGTYYVTAPTVGDPLLATSSDWTLSMWVNYRGTTTPWCNVGGFSIGENCFRIQRTNQNTYQLYCDQTTRIGNSDDTKAIPGGSTTDWVNLVFVYHAATQTLDIYSNAELWGSVTREAFKDKALTSISMGNYVINSIAGGTMTKEGRTTYTSVIDEVAVYDFAANGAQIEWLGKNAPSTAMFGEKEPEEITAYYKSGYFGNSSNPLVLVDAAGKNITYSGVESKWTVIIDETHLASGTTTAWCSEQSYYRSNPINIVKIIVKATNFTFKPGVSDALFDGVELEVAEGAKLTLTKDSGRNMSLGAVTFSGDGEVDASSGVAFTKPITTKGNVKVNMPANAFVATVDGTEYLTLTDAFKAAKPSGTIKVIAANWPTTALPEGFKDSEQWQGTVQFTGTMPNGFVPSNYGNVSSTIEFKGVSGGHITYTSLDFPGAIKLTNKGETAAWTVFDGYSGDSYPLSFGALTGDGDLMDIGNAKQPFVFQDASKFRGSITSVLKRFIVGDKIYNDGDGRIYVQSGYDLAVASRKSLKAANGIYVDGTIKGSGTLASATIFGNTAVIDCSEGSLTASGAVTFGSTLTIKNAEEGGVVLKCSLEPVNLRDVMLKDENGSLMPLAHLEYDQGAGEVRYFARTKKISGTGTWEVTNPMLNAFSKEFVLDLSEYYGEGGGKPIGESSHILIKFPSGTTTDASQAVIDKIQVVYPTLHAAGSLSASGNKIFFTFGHLDLYWSKWRGTFWEAVFGGDVHGNNGFGRTESGAEQAILAGDTVIFDKRHYQVAGEFAEKSPYWHYDENLYIKDEVNPGVNNDWDLKVLEGVTLKMGLRGARTTGQNIIKDFKIYVEKDSTLELGYWGNTHHYQGVIRPDVTFGGAGTITLGDDMGSSCRVEGDLKVKQDPSAQETKVPTLNVRGKELVVEGGQIDVNLTGFGALSGSGTITTPITFNNATINATDANGFTFKNKTTFTGTLTVDMTAAPTGDNLIKICTKGEGGSFSFTEGIDVLVRVNGSVQPAFYTLATDSNGNLCVKVAPTQITYDAEVVLGYDYKTMICRVTMTPAIEGVAAEVTVSDVAAKLTTWTAPVVGMRGSGRAEVMVGDADNNFEPGTYSMTVSVGGWQKNLNYTLSVANDGNLAEVNGFGYKTMQEAVAVAGESGTIKLLTNVFFAPPPGDYTIERGEYDVYITNDMEMSAQESAVKIAAPKTIDHYVLWTGCPFVIEGNWLGTALPWKTQKQIKSALTTESAINGIKPFEAYVLGIPAAEMGTYKPIVRGVQTDDPNTIELTDDLPIKDAAETGVVVTRKLVDAETKEEVCASAVYDLSQMNGKSKLLKLGYIFAPDDGQD